MRIYVYTRDGQCYLYENVNDYKVHNCGPGLLVIRYDESDVDYFRLGYVNRWKVKDDEKIQPYSGRERKNVI